MLLNPEHDERWYERRKRSLVLGSLTCPRYARIFEPACGRGRLTCELAQRSDALIAMDLDPRAIADARSATAGLRHVEVRKGLVPRDWPTDESFDLIVLSEFLYYLPIEQLPTLCAAALSTLDADGEIIACHWRHPIPETAHWAREIHGRCAESLGLFCLTELSDADFVLHVWSRRASSVARREGLAP